MLFIGFLEKNLAVAAAAAISLVALLVLLVLVAVAAAIAVADLRHDGFENRKREGVWGEGTAPPPNALGGPRCSLVVVP